MSDCLHATLLLTTQRGTDGFPIYYCGVCRENFKVKPLEISVSNHDEVQRAITEE